MNLYICLVILIDLDVNAEDLIIVDEGLIMDLLINIYVFYFPRIWQLLGDRKLQIHHVQFWQDKIQLQLFINNKC